MPDRSGESIIEVSLTDIANGGQGVGRSDGRPIFIPYTIPGELVQARITDDRGRYAFAEGLHVLEVSADRVLPRCPHFGPGRCGNCQWQHIDYPAQLALKTDILLDQLGRVGKFDVDALDLRSALPSPEQWYYAHHARFYPTAEGKLGFRRENGAGILPIEECHIITPALFALFEQLDFDLPLTQAQLWENRDDDRMLVLSVAGDEAPSLELDFKASVNFLLSDNVPVNLIGKTHLVYTILGRAYRVTAGCSLRANLPQLENLLRLLRDSLALTGKETVLDLYAGSGIISGALAADASLITCIDSYPPAMTDAEYNLEAFDHIDLIEGDVANVVPQLSEHYDLVILDPPTKGMEAAAVDALASLSPARLAYIGDDAASLSRDLQRLTRAHGYRIEWIQAMDFAPQTAAVTAVALLSNDRT